MATCTVGTCDRPLKTNGLCRTHYMRWWSTGSVQADRPIRAYRQTPDEKLWRFVEKTEGCWLWTGATNRGYGYLRDDTTGRSVLVHRLAYTLLVGPIPDRRQLDHACHTRDKTCRGGPTCLHRRCVNPAHLEPVTNQENCKRGRVGDRTRERAAKITHCPHGHEYEVVGYYRNSATGTRICKECTRQRGLAKSLKGQGIRDPRRVSDEKVAEVRDLLAAGRSHSQIAAATGVSAATVSRIRNGGSWYARP